MNDREFNAYDALRRISNSLRRPTEIDDSNYDYPIDKGDSFYHYFHSGLVTRNINNKHCSKQCFII